MLLSLLLWHTMALGFGDSTPSSKTAKSAKGEVFKSVCFDTMANCESFKEKMTALLSAEGGFSKDGSTLTGSGACHEASEEDERPSCHEADAIYQIRFTSTVKIK